MPITALRAYEGVKTHTGRFRNRTHFYQRIVGYIIQIIYASTYIIYVGHIDNEAVSSNTLAMRKVFNAS